MVWAVLTTRRALLRLYAALLLVCVVGATASAQTVVLSEGFESPAAPTLPTGWTSSATGGGNAFVSSTNSPITGNQSARAQKSGGTAGATATLNSASFTTISHTYYTVTFSLANASRMSLVANLSGLAGQTISTTTGSKSFEFQATSTTSSIFFLATQTSNGNSELILDNIVVREKVPELNASAAQLPLTLLVGLLLVLYDRRRAMIGCG